MNLEKSLEAKGIRGKIEEHETKNQIKLERKLLEKYYSITLNKEVCNGCGVCAEVCPKEAINQIPAEIKEGALVRKPSISFSTESCIFCGECAVLCPLNALTMRINGEETSTVEKNEAFPSLLKGIEVAKEEITSHDPGSNHKTEYTELLRCKPECEIRCEKECPTEAIKVSVERSDDNKIVKIIDVKIDETKCNYCKRCEIACPYDAIKVQKPFHGKLEVNTDLCPEGCVACQDICPTKAIVREDGNLVVSSKFCVFCSACQKICPEEAITFNRDQIFHTCIKAAAWLTALKKLTSEETVIRELQGKSSKKKHSMVKKRRLDII